LTKIITRRCRTPSVYNFKQPKRRKEMKIIEQKTSAADYDLPCKEAIVDHDTMGRLYIAEGFGGLDSLEGGQMRWKHGFAIKIEKSDTLENLHERRWNDETTYYQAMLAGAYGKILNWQGYMIEMLACQLGL